MEQIFPFWSDLTADEQKYLQENIQKKSYRKGELLHRTDAGCLGLMAVNSGCLRTYIVSEQGREVTLFRVREKEISVLSASCLMDSIEFEILIEASEDTEVLLVPSSVLQRIKEQNLQVELYLYKAATEKFSDVMWTIQQIMFLRIDQRVAQCLWDEMIHQNTQSLQLTHDEIARYIGSAREVVSRVMKYLARENVVVLSRGKIEIVDKKKLKSLI